VTSLEPLYILKYPCPAVKARAVQLQKNVFILAQGHTKATPLYSEPPTRSRQDVHTLAYVDVVASGPLIRR